MWRCLQSAKYCSSKEPEEETSHEPLYKPEEQQVAKMVRQPFFVLTIESDFSSTASITFANPQSLVGRGSHSILIPCLPFCCLCQTWFSSAQLELNYRQERIMEIQESQVSRLKKILEEHNIEHDV